MTMSDNTIEVEGLGSFFKKLGRFSAKAGKKLATILIENPAELWKLLKTLLPQPQLEFQKQH